MAMTVRSEKYIRYAGAKGVSEVVAEIDVDTSAELPGIDGIPGIRLHQGSTALVIKEGILAVLAGDGSWADQSGSVIKEASNESA